MGKYENKRSSLHEYKSKQRLAANMKKKIQTTMIGALSSIEEHFGFLWNDNFLSEQERSMIQDKFESLRSEILDKGNRQLRNVDAEFLEYTISHLEKDGKHITFFTNRGDYDE